MDKQDLYLSDEQRAEIADKYLHHSFPDMVIIATAQAASNHTLKMLIKEIEKDKHFADDLDDEIDGDVAECVIFTKKLYQAFKKIVED